MRGKSFRRHQMEKRKSWAKRAIKERYGSPPTDKQIGMFADTPKMCSCHMCGNQRKHWGDKFSDIKKKYDYTSEIHIL